MAELQTSFGSPAPASSSASWPPVYPKDPYTNVFPLDIPCEKRNYMNSPMFLVNGCGNGSLTYQGGDDSSGKWKQHTIHFKGDTFTVDDGPLRNINDPEIRSFLTSLINKKVPTEFGEGCHVITVTKFDGDDIEEEDLILNYSDEPSDDSSYYSDSDEE